jgi:glycosyltransferase involved in cell wall biosynthesis
VRVAFYAPLKAADDPRPSGDRQMARLLMAALARAGSTVETASRFATFDPGNPHRQQRLAALGQRIAASVIRRYSHRPAGARPDLWFTYHLYHKAPDWLGPQVSRALALPYVVAEASHSPKQAFGPWAFGHAAVARALGTADLVFNLNGTDAACVRPLLADPARLVALAPFVEVAAYDVQTRRRRARAAMATRLGLAAETPVLLCVAMMRPGDKVASYRCLARALERLLDLPWRLLVVGDGPAAGAVHAALAPLQERVTATGQCEGSTLLDAYAAADLYLWPAIGEAYGIALLEAQAAGLPVVAGRTGGVPEVVGDRVTGLLVPAGDATAFAAAVRCLLRDPERRLAMATAARDRVRRRHDLGVAADRIRAKLVTLMGSHRP